MLKTDFSLTTPLLPSLIFQHPFLSSLFTFVIFLGLICAQKQFWSHLLWLHHHFGLYLFITFQKSRVFIFVAVNLHSLRNPIKDTKQRVWEDPNGKICRTDYKRGECRTENPRDLPRVSREYLAEYRSMHVHVKTTWEGKELSRTHTGPEIILIATTKWGKLLISRAINRTKDDLTSEVTNLCFMWILFLSSLTKPTSKIQMDQNFPK